MNIIDFLCKIKICATSGEARRLILTKAIKIDDVIMDNPDYIIDKETYLKNNHPVIYITKGRRHLYKYDFINDMLFIYKESNVSTINVKDYIEDKKIPKLLGKAIVNIHDYSSFPNMTDLLDEAVKYIESYIETNKEKPLDKYILPRRINNNEDVVNHPSHYTDGKYEVIDFIEESGVGFHLGNAIKYLSRAGKKNPAKTIEDCKKAIWYINRYSSSLS